MSRPESATIYPAAADILCRDVVPLLEEAGVNLVYSGHSHLWNRFVSAAGVNYLGGIQHGEQLRGVSSADRSQQTGSAAALVDR